MLSQMWGSRIGDSSGVLKGRFCFASLHVQHTVYGKERYVFGIYGVQVVIVLAMRTSNGLYLRLMGVSGIPWNEIKR